MREMFTTARVRVRAEPSTKSVALRTLEKGTRLVSTTEDGGWFRISHENAEGWIRGDYLTERPPEVVMAPDQPPAAIVSKQQRQVAPVRAARTGEPVRQAYTGRCDCPYDRMRNGRRCGGNSAWSKPGGRQSVCFVGTRRYPAQLSGFCDFCSSGHGGSSGLKSRARQPNRSNA
jgi:hypothetical protein